MKKAPETMSRVAYSRDFLKSIADYTYWTARRRGTVISVETSDKIDKARFCWVLWDDDETPSLVNFANLHPADKLHLEKA